MDVFQPTAVSLMSFAWSSVYGGSTAKPSTAVIASTAFAIASPCISARLRNRIARRIDDDPHGLAGCTQGWRVPARAVHMLPAMQRFRIFSIACGYEDARTTRCRAAQYAARLG